MDIGAIGRILCIVVVCIVVVSIFAYILYRSRSQLFPSRYSVGLLIGGSLALVLTWYLLFWFMTLATGRILAPWDQWASLAPPQDAWQRQLNDFFSRNITQYLAALVVIGISGILFLAGMFQSASNVRDKLPLAFALTNLAFLLVAFLLIVPAGYLPDLWLPQPRPSIDVGYHRTWLDILITGVLLGLLFWVQRRIATLSFWRQSIKYSAFVAGGDK